MNGTLLGFASLVIAIALGSAALANGADFPGGLPLALGALAGGSLPVFRGLPIPKAILLDVRGAVRRIDECTDHRVRSAPERVRAALNAALA